MEIKTEDYHVWLNEQDGVIYFEGSFRLSDSDAYAEILALLNRHLESDREAMAIDLRALQFLNSSGINTLAKFVISARKAERCKLTIRGSKLIPWQGKSLANLKKLYPALSLDID